MNARMFQLNHNPFPMRSRTREDAKAGADGRPVLILDERCYCGALKSQHNGAGPLFGCGACPATKCARFTWASWVEGLAAYAATVDEKGFGIGLAVSGEQGYHPRPDHCRFHTWEAAQAAAELLNEGLGLSRDVAFDVVASTMRSEVVLDEVASTPRNRPPRRGKRVVRGSR